MEMPVRRSDPASVTAHVNLSRSEFSHFVVLLAAHRVVRQLAPELADDAIAELCRLRGFRHNLN